MKAFACSSHRIVASPTGPGRCHRGWRLVLLACPLLALAACKVEIRVPEGGEVEARSGDYRCGAGETCTIEVSDTDFDEVFRAVPDANHEFVGWRAQSRYFCGGREDDCHLSTTGFGGNPGLMALLASEDVFYLAPRFRPAETYSLSGTISPRGDDRADIDTNDEGTSPVVERNDSFGEAQDVPTPSRIGGYAAAFQAGEPGALSHDGSDYYRVSLRAGQRVSLVVADPHLGDLDLYLYDENRVNVDFSQEYTALDQVIAPRDGRYFVEVQTWIGASNYTLFVGQSSGSEARLTGFNGRSDYIPGEALVRFRDTGGTPGVAGAARVVPRKMRIADLRMSNGPGVASAAKIPGPFASAELERRWRELTTLKQLRKRKDIDYAEPNFVARAQQVVPDDSHYPDQWNYPLIGLPTAWEVTRGSADVTVAVIDSGVLRWHPDLRGKLVDGYDFISYPDLSLDGDGIDANPADPGAGPGAEYASFHGTHVAGIIGAATDNGEGVAGAGWATRIMPLRVIGQGGFTTIYDVIQALRYAVQLDNDAGTLPARRADIVNMSIGMPFWSEAFSDTLREVRDAGVVVVASAGNENSDRLSYPSAYPGVLGVGAVDSHGERVDYSNYGTHVDLLAPGGSFDGQLVLSLFGGGTGADRSYGVEYRAGTSMAAPHVAGVVALMKALRPDLGPEDVDYLLRSGALTRDLGLPGWDPLHGYGLLDAHGAVLAARDYQRPGADDNPVLAVHPARLVIGGDGGGVFTLDNSGTGPLEVHSVTADASWLAIEPVEVGSGGLGRYRASTPGTLQPGSYQGTIEVRASTGTVQVPIEALVGEDNGAASSGLLYIILRSDHSAFERILARRPVNGKYYFSFPGVKAGNYAITVSTDMDNDYQTCDPGEACGTYPNRSEPELIRLDRDRRDLNIQVDFENAPPPTP